MTRSRRQVIGVEVRHTGPPRSGCYHGAYEALATAGGPGAAALAVSYAAARGLSVLAITHDFTRFPGCATERQTAKLVELADAAVVVGEEAAGLSELVARLKAKGVRVLVVGKEKAKPVGEVQVEKPRYAMPPD